MLNDGVFMASEKSAGCCEGFVYNFARKSILEGKQIAKQAWSRFQIRALLSLNSGMSSKQ